MVGFRTDFVTYVWITDAFAGVLALAGLRPAGARKPQGGAQGRGTTLKLGGGQTSPGVQCNSYPKLKLPGFGPLFLGETQVHVQKQTKMKMNNIDHPKLGGSAPTQLPSCWGKLPPTAPPVLASLGAPLPPPPPCCLTVGLTRALERV